MDADDVAMTVSPPQEPCWPELVADVLDDPSRLTLVFQPIVSLTDGVVVGYEALSRFPALPRVTPDRWFAAADRLGRGAELESLVVGRCLVVRDTLPPGCFLTVNVSPHLLTEPALADLLLSAGDLFPLVLELTEHQDVANVPRLVQLCDRLTAAGALMALDDAGSGYSGLQQMARMRPHLVKLDRALVQDADRDQVKLALAELLGEFAGRIDAWLLAEGVETWGELEAFQRLRVPLAQGYLLGRPGPPWVTLDPSTADRLRRGAARVELVENVASLVEPVPGPGETLLPDQVGLTVDAMGRPLVLLLPQHREQDEPGSHREAAVSLRVPSSAGVVEVARRLAARPASCRFDPVVCVDDLGRASGIVRVEEVLLRLAQLKSGR